MSQDLTFELSKSQAPLICGEHSANITYLEDTLRLSAQDRGNTLTLTGLPADLNKADHVMQALLRRANEGKAITRKDIDTALRFFDEAPAPKANGKSNGTASDLVIKTKKKTIVPRSPNQAAYVQHIMDKEMVFGLGPAGTGKTYLAVAQGVSLYLQGKVERLIFTRPAVEAGEKWGFLPGDMREKIDPYLRPIFDALQDMLPHDFMIKRMEAGDIEIAPLAFMRGRTLSHAFVILDEAQNTSRTQMQMVLTRMGEGTRMVITGDMSQTDLPRGQISGLRDACDILRDVPEIGFHRFTSDDVVRHALVGKIIKAYDDHGRD